MVTKKHGTTQGRLNTAREYANSFVEDVNQMSLIWNLSVNGRVEEDVAENYIKGTVEDLKEKLECFLSYIEQKDNLR